MRIAVEPPKSTRIRALALQHPELTEAQIAHRLGVLKAQVRNALSKDPRPRVKSVAR
jgi:hypothetical protein